MGKAKTSRKGKKAWRANIANGDIDDFFEKSTKDALSGGSLTAVPSESLFYVDKSRDLSAKRKIEKHREKVLRCDSLLQRNPFVKPIPSSILKKSKRKLKEDLKAKLESLNASKVQHDAPTEIVDIWDDKGEEGARTKKKPKPSVSVIPAVEVEPPGCSFNPSYEAHQDSLALAVAAEMHKIYRDELGPQPVPLTVPGEVLDEEEMYFLDADDGSDDDLGEENLSLDNEAAIEQRTSKKKRVTRVEQNRRARRKELLKTEEVAKKVNRLSKDIDCVSEIVNEIAREDEDKQNRNLRRLVAKQEKLKAGPPRLGKHKFVPAPVQVLLTEEISGSLRKLKGCSTLARDRFKSYEKRGLLVPTPNRKRK